MRRRKSVLAVLLAGAMIVGSVAGCGSNSSDAGNTTDKAQEGTTQEAGSTTAGSDTPLVIATDSMSEKFSPFFGNSVPDRDVYEKTMVKLLDNDRAGEFIFNGIEGETKSYNGTDYTYKGIADLAVTENEDGTVYYDFKLREDVKFSDGENLTADDVIFTYYVFSDPSYDGSSTIYSLPIEGMEEYRSGSVILYNLMLEKGAENTDFTYYTEEQQKQFFETDLPAAGEAFAKSISDYCIANGYVTIEADEVANGMNNWGFADLNEDGSITSASGKTWTLVDGDVPTLADYWNELEMKYDYDYATLSETEAADAPLFDFLSDSYKTTVETGESAPNITGIQKTGEYSVRFVMTEANGPALTQFQAEICPLHYYGDESLYDYENNMFGFTKGDLSSVRAKTTAPMGAGPYKFIKYENKTAYFEANEHYYKGAPAIKYMQIKETAEADKVPGVVQGTIDLSTLSVSKATLEQIKGYNSNGEIIGETVGTYLVDYNGYGYIGINSETVKVGEDNGSEESKNLRKAIATVLSVYRDVVIDSYYGDAAAVINYPISNTSWAAPQKSDADYAVAFSKDVDGNDIYTDGMSEDEKYAAALNAALGYFEAAGYTVTDGKLTAAPEGAKLAYEMMIGGGGIGDHPSFGVATAAAEALASIGFTLTINDLSDTSIMWAAIEGNTAELWCAAWSATLDPDMYQIYHSEGGTAYQYSIYDEELDKLVEEGRNSTDQTYRKAVYKEALDFVVDFAVEVPVYQRQEATLISTARINEETIPKDLTSYYTFVYEIEKLQLK